MIGTIRKHQNWLWAVIIAVIIVSFVIFFSPTSKMDFMGGSQKYDFGSINGKPISREQYFDAEKEASIYFRFRYREWPTAEILKMAGVNLEQDTYNRILLVEKLKELNVHPSTEATVNLMSEIFSGENGAFSMDRYQSFVKDLEAHGMSKNDLERFVQNEIGQQHLVGIFGLSGKLVPPQEAERLYKEQNELLSVDAIFFSASNYLSQVKVDDKAVGEFFTQQMSRYHIPERVQVQYVKFNLTNFLSSDADLLTQIKKMNPQAGQLTNISQAVDQFYQGRGPANFKDKQGNPLSETAAKQQIKEDMHRQLALSTARKEAADFITALFSYAETNKADKAALETVATSKNLKVQETPLFDEQKGPKDMKVSGAFVQTAFNLTEEAPYSSSAVETEDAVYVLAFKKRVPGENPPLATVKAQVVEDYKMNEARKLARKAGDEFQATLSKSLADGRKFESICAQEKVKPVSLPPFSQATRSMPELKDRITLDRLQNAANRLAVGKNTDLMATEEGGAVIYLRSRMPVSEEKMKADLPDFVKSVAEQRQYAAYNHWFQKQQEAMKLMVPNRTAKK